MEDLYLEVYEYDNAVDNGTPVLCTKEALMVPLGLLESP